MASAKDTNSIKENVNSSTKTKISKPMCRYFKAGNCIKGEMCVFSHSFPHSVGVAFPDAQIYLNSAKSYAYPKRMPICLYFKRGYCKAGNNCNFYHPNPTPRWKRREHFLSRNNNQESVYGNRAENKVECENSIEISECEVICQNSAKEFCQQKSCDNSAEYITFKESINLDNELSNKNKILSADSAVSKSSEKESNLSLNSNKVYNSSLLNEDILQLKFIELAQFKKRFPSYEIIEENNSFSFGIQPTDPDWPYNLKELKLQVTFPKMYPREICQINVVKGDDYIQESLLRHVNLSISTWLSSRYKTSLKSNQVELVFRPFLKWFDRNLEDIFKVGLNREKENIEVQIQALGINPLPTDSNLPSCDDCDVKKESHPEISSLEHSETENKKLVSIPQDATVPKTLIYSLNQQQGVKILLTGLEFIEGVAALTCTKLEAMLRCIRCKTSCNAAASANKSVYVNCSKCFKKMQCNYNPSLLHPHSNLLGSVHLVQCQVVDINVVESAFLLDCLNCSKQVGFSGVHYGQKQVRWCKFCNQKLVISVGSVKFQGSTPSSAASSTIDKGVKTTKKKNDPLIKEGNPLPEFGACKHYKKSNRWLRFPCCGRVYPCDVCHEEKESDHEMKLASRMICGFCSKEQPYSKDKPCTKCASGMVAKSHCTHWEGGKGCRNKAKMARDDKHKYAGASKTLSKKKQNLGKKTK